VSRDESEARDVSALTFTTRDADLGLFFTVSGRSHASLSGILLWGVVWGVVWGGLWGGLSHQVL
jgi:hypothetical protein